jgi:pilus assembly protein CpaC
MCVWGQVSGGEADVKSQYKKQNDLAGGSRRHADRIIKDAGLQIGALLRRGWIRAVLAASVVAALPPAVRAQQNIVLASPVHSAQVRVTVGKTEDIRTDQNFANITVGDPDIADVSPLTDHSLSILGKKIGTTRVTLYGEGKKLVGVFDIEVSYDVSKLREELAQRYPSAKIRVSTANGRVLLSGNAPDGIVLDSILSVARQFGPDVINSIQVAQPQQVMLEVRFIEASREADRELGVQWNIGPRPGSQGNFIANIGSGQPASVLPITSTSTTSPITSLVNAAGIAPGAAGVIGTATAPFGFIAGNMVLKGLQIDPMLNALEQQGLVRRLAEPNLVALSGETANFLAGGEYPIPVPGLGAGQITVDYKQYGVSLAFTPTVLNGNLINLKIIPEVSQLDPSNSVAIGNGIVVPALTVRRATTTLELKDGQSFVLAGLLQNNLSTAQQQLPWLGDVPVLGALFSSKSYQKNETDLIIIVTPHLVNPTRPGDDVRTPLDTTLAPNDIDFFLKNRNEVPRTEARGGGAMVERGPIGHMLALPKGGINAAAQ